VDGPALEHLRGVHGVGADRAPAPAGESVSQFPDPFVHRVHRRCRNCGTWWEIMLLGGASCPRDPYYTCSDCRDGLEATPARLALIEAQARPQLRLVDEVDGG
jgi:hypothetical protein